MEKISEFIMAASPCVAMGLLLAVFCVMASSRIIKDDKSEDHASEGIALGMCFGVAIGTALHINIGLGMMAGMVIGLIAGSKIPKKDMGNNEIADEEKDDNR